MPDAVFSHVTTKAASALNATAPATPSVSTHRKKNVVKMKVDKYSFHSVEIFTTKEVVRSVISKEFMKVGKCEEK